MQVYSATDVLLSFVVTWAVILPPPILIRAIWRRPLGRKMAISFCIVFYFVNHIVFGMLGSQSKSHFAIFIGAWASYYILQWHTRASAERYAREQRQAFGYAEAKIENDAPREGVYKLKNYDVFLVRSAQWLLLIVGPIAFSYFTMLVIVFMVDQKSIAFSDYAENVLFLEGKPIALLIGWVLIVIAAVVQFKSELCRDVQTTFVMKKWLRLKKWYCSLREDYAGRER